ncbi:MAG: caspase family protein [Bacteroidota bacterium]
MTSPKRISWLFLCLLLASANLLAQSKLKPIVQFGHPGMMVTEIVLSPDGKSIATTDGQYVKLWDLRSGLEYKSFYGTKGSMFGPGVSDLSFSPDGRQITYMTSMERITRDILTEEISEKTSMMNQEIFRKIEQNEEVTNEDFQSIEIYRSGTYSPDRSLAATMTNKKLEITRLSDNKVVQVIDVKMDGLASLIGSSDVQFSLDNQTILLDSTLYEVESGEKKFVFEPYKMKQAMTKAVFSPKDQSIIFFTATLPDEEAMKGFSFANMADMAKYMMKLFESSGELMHIVDPETGQIRRSIETTTVTTCITTPDGQRLITGHLNNEVNIWDLETFELLKTLVDPFDRAEGFGIRSLCLTQDAKSLIIGSSGSSDDPKVFICELESGKTFQKLGAAIPPITMEIEPTRLDSIILEEVELAQNLHPLLKEKKFISYRMLSLTDGRVPHAFPKYDSIVFSPALNYYALLPQINGPIRVFHSEDNDDVSELEESDGNFDKLIFSPNGEWIAGQTSSKTLIWETTSGSLRHQLDKDGSPFYNMVFDPSNRSIGLTHTDRSIRFWSLEDGRLIREKEATLGERIIAGITGTADQVEKADKAIEEEKSGGVLGALDGLGTKIPGRNLLGGKERGVFGAAKAINQFGGLAFNKYSDIDISPDGKYAALWRDDHASVRFYNLESGRQMRLWTDWNLKLMQELFLKNTPDASSMKTDSLHQDTLDQSMSSSAMFMQLLGGKTLKEYSSISPDWTRMAVLPHSGFFGSAKNIKKIKNKKKRAKKERQQRLKENIAMRYLTKNMKKKDYILKDSKAYQSNVAFSPDGNMVAASSSEANNIRIWDAKTGEILKTLQGHSGQVSFSPSGKTLISNGWDRQVKVWDLEKDQELYSFIGIKGENEYIIMLPSGYYTASRKDTRALAFVDGRDVFPFDQFDLMFNRPDLVLQEFESSIGDSTSVNQNKNLRQAYRAAHQMRMERMGIQATDGATKLNLPTVEIQSLPLSSADKKLALQIKAVDALEPLSSIHLLVNGVPVLPDGQESILDQKVQSFEREYALELSPGENRIQAYALNASGAMSIKEYAVVNYTGPVTKGDLHLVLMGASKFQNDSFNLLYPREDLEDVAELFGSQRSQFETVQVHRLIDQDFTAEASEDLLKKLQDVNVGDRVIIMLATHGMLSRDFKYYLATHDTDFDNPQNTSLPYESLNKWLMNIPARQKLLLLDACHAGEADSTILKQIEVKNTSNTKMIVRSTPSTGWEAVDELSAFDYTKSLFVDLRSGTGTTVIGSAKAQDYAYEAPDWGNSIFTYCLKRGINKGVADLNSDGEIHLSELQQYLSTSVKRLTSNKQQPVHRAENILNDWQIW